MADNAVEEPTPLYKDFDEGTDYAAPIRIKVLGREYDLPGDPPAGPILMGMKQGLSIQNDSAEMVKFLELMIGPARLDQMIQDGIGIKQLNSLSDFVIKQYGFDDEVEDGEAPKVQAPRHVRRAKKSSKNGASSKRTSGGSTASVSRI